MTDAVIAIDDMTRRFGRFAALDRVSLRVRPGIVVGLIGPSGAGKTTLARHVLGLLRPDSGTVRVFGRDPVADPAGVLVRVGYLSQDRDLPGWLTFDQLLRCTRAYYPKWDDAYAADLRQSLQLAARARLRNLSHGERSRVGLVLALAHRPDLLVLDEPSAGLDPVLRRHVLQAVVRAVADDGRTVILSTHELGDIERVADRVAMIVGGRIAFEADTDELKQTHRAVTIRLDDASDRPPEVSGAFAWERAGAEWTAVVTGPPEVWRNALAERGGKVVGERVPSLEEIFVARSGGNGP